VLHRGRALCLASAAAVALLCSAGRTRAAESLPAAFANRTNPHAGETAARDSGRALFLDNCAQCHGEAADGAGPAGRGLVPPPANLAGPEIVPRHSDAYLFYRLTVGKSGTAMPSFHGTLSEEERWLIVTYLRDLARQWTPDDHVSAAPGAAARADPPAAPVAR
jgi:mono/diheme cytochrome c family protein